MKEFLQWFWSTYLVVSVFAFYSDDPNSNLTEMYSFYSLKLLHENENKLKRDRHDRINKFEGNNKQKSLVVAVVVAVVVAQLAERSLPVPEDPGSNPVFCNFY